jgi:methylmalonyl-CoA mutase
MATPFGLAKENIKDICKNCQANFSCVGPVAGLPNYSESSMNIVFIVTRIIMNEDYLDEQWQLLAKRELSDKDLSDISSMSLEGIAIKPLYTRKDLPADNASYPGIFPFKRGIRATMYTHRPWTIRQYAGFSSAQASNNFYRECLAQGQKGLSVAFDLPTHRGYDSDHPLVAGDVGMAGVAIDSVLDMKTLFHDIDLSQVSVSMTMNGAVLPVLAAFIVAAKESGIAQERLEGTIQNDILKEFMVRNTFIYPPKPSMRIVADIIEYCTHYMPKFNSISISGYHIHEAGADLGTELGLTLADGLEYVKTALKRGIELDRFAPRLSFFFATGMNFFMEIAKLRAARMLWAEAMQGLGAKNPQSLLLRTHCQTSGWSLTAQDPYNNIIRTTIEALAAVLGGTQSLHTNSFDEAIALPTPFSARIARNTQLIMQHESKITQVIDPLGGSYYLESLTEELKEKAQQIMKHIEDAGGMSEALLAGIPMRWIHESALKRQALIDSKKEVIVGVNCYESTEEKSFETLTIDNKQVLKEQLRSLEKLKASRDQNAVTQALHALSEGALSSSNLLELSINAIQKRATIGEVSMALERVFKRYEPIATTLTGIYDATLKDSTELRILQNDIKNFAQKEGRQPRILVAKMGQDGHDRGAKVIASAFADFGFDVDLSPLFQSPISIAQQALDNDVHVIGISSLAAAHKTLIPALLEELRKKDANDIIVIVGGVIPPQDQEELKKLGVADIFGPGTSALSAASRVLARLKR